MKKTPLFCLILVLCMQLTALSAVAAPADVDTSGCRSLHASLPLAGSEKRLDTAEAVILYELNAKTLIYTWKPDNRINPSSMVKILTALVALKYGNLEDIVTIKRATLDSIPIGSVSAGLKRDEEISAGNLLYCMVVSSANDAAAALAEHISGTQEAFVDLMNQTAAELGCTGSNFTNVTGLNDENQYSTARDLAIITEAALENPLFTEMFGAEQYSVPATNKSEARTVYTTNFMMSELKVKNYYDARVTGGKTAAATLTNRSLICTAQVGNTRFLCVVMGAEAEVSEDKLSVTRYGSFIETAQLLDFGFKTYSAYQVLSAGSVYDQFAVSGGANDVIAAPAEDLFAALPVDFDAEKLSFVPAVDVALLKAPLQKGAELGSLQVRYDGILLGQCKLLAMFDVPIEGSVFSVAPPLLQEDQGIDPRIWIYLGIALGSLVLLAGIVLLSLRIVRNTRIRAMHRKRKRNRRRSR